MRVPREAAAALGLNLDRRQIEQLEAYRALLEERAVPLGAISRNDAGHILPRHIADSLRAALAVRESDRHAYDLGSGAGLPGVVVAIACPALTVTLIESRARRAAFLELAVERLPLPNVSVYAGRAEDLVQKVDVCFARAFADAGSTWRVAERLLVSGGRLVYFAGATFDPPRDVPAGVRYEILSSVDTPVASFGALVMMTRQ